MGDSLLTESQFEASEAFKAEHIYPQIVRDWRGDDLAHEWLAENAPRYTFPATSTPYCNPITNSVNKGPLGIGIDALELWRSGRQEALIKIYEELPTTSVEFWNALVAADPTVITNHETDILRVEKDLFRRQRFLGILNNRTSEEDSVPQTKSSMKPKFKYTDREDAPMMYQELLPTGMYTALTVYARIPPGPEISAGCLGIASLVARGDIRIEWTPDEIIRHIEPLGGLAYLINQPIDPRLH